MQKYAANRKSLVPATAFREENEEEEEEDDEDFFVDVSTMKWNGISGNREIGTLLGLNDTALTELLWGVGR